MAISALDLEHNPGNVVDYLKRLKAGIDELERFMPSGLFDGTTAMFPGDVDGSSGRMTPKFLNLGAATELTISGGVITITSSNHTVETEGGAGADDLDTINGGAENDVLLLRAADAAHTVTVKNGTGNISCGADFALDDDDDTMLLFYDGTNWLELCSSNNA